MSYRDAGLLGHRSTGRSRLGLGTAAATKQSWSPAAWSSWNFSNSRRSSSLLIDRSVLVAESILFAAALILFIMSFRNFAVAACAAGLVAASPIEILEARASVGFQSSNVPQEYQTLPEL